MYNSIYICWKWNQGQITSCLLSHDIFFPAFVALNTKSQCFQTYNTIMQYDSPQVWQTWYSQSFVKVWVVTYKNRKTMEKS